MSEQVHGNDPKQKLIALLQADFTSPETHMLAQEAGDDALKGLLAQARAAEEIDARLMSNENIELGEAVERLLEPAPVTESFKGFIAAEVRQAQARQSAVDDSVSPDRLRLLSSDGIFDPKRAKEIESQTVRGRLFDIINRYTTAFAVEGETESPVLVMNPAVIRPSDYRVMIDSLQKWASDYLTTYGGDPFDSLEGEAYLDAAHQVVVPKEIGFAAVIKQLRGLNKEEEQD